MAITYLTPILDGFARRTGVNEPFGTIRAGSGNAYNDTSSINVATSLVASGTTDQYVEITRGIFVFDLSSIPSDHIVTAVQFSIFNAGISNDLAQNLGLTQAFPASDLSLANSDYDIANFGGTRLATDEPLTGFAGLFTFDANGVAYIDGVVASAGHARIGLRVSSDINGSPPTWISGGQSYIIIRWSEYGGNKPTLAVTHQPGEKGSPLFIFT